MEQVQPVDPVLLVTAKPGGSVSVAVAPVVAGYGPLFFGLKTKVTLPEEATGLGVGELWETCRSAPASTVALATAALFDGSGSPTVEEMLPFSVTVPAATPVTLVTIGKLA